MKFHADCVACLTRNALKKAEPVKDEALKLAFMRSVCAVIDNIDPQYHSSPLVEAEIIRLGREILGIQEDYTEIKHRYNRLVMSLYAQLKAQVRAADDPLHAAIQLSMAGNYIDFNVLKDIEPDKVLKMIEDASHRALDAGEYAHLRSDLLGAREAVFLHDNCGEVVLDRLLIETMRELNPELHVLSVVRASMTANDVTMEDAREVALGEVAEVVDNGLPDVPGTQVDRLSPALRERLARAGLVIAKGQGNFETMTGCGLNVYYLLLSKCSGYKAWFGFEHLAGIFKNERRM